MNPWLSLLQNNPQQQENIEQMNMTALPQLPSAQAMSNEDMAALQALSALPARGDKSSLNRLMADRVRESIDLQKANLQNERQKAQLLGGAEAGIDLTPLMALSDQWFGGNLSKNYRAPNQVEDALAQLRKYGESGIAQQKAITNDEAQLAQMQFNAQQAVEESKRKSREEAERMELKKLAMEALGEEKTIKREEKAKEKAKLSDKQIEKFTYFDSAESDLNNLASLVSGKPEWLGPIDGSIPSLLISGEQDAFRSAIGKYKDAYRKAITGAGASEFEIKKLETRLPSEYDKPGNFIAKANEAVKELNRYRNIMAENLIKAGKDASDFAGEPVQASSEDQQALDWAMKNPKDPRAAAIRAKLGK